MPIFLPLIAAGLETRLGLWGLVRDEGLTIDPLANCTLFGQHIHVLARLMSLFHVPNEFRALMNRILFIAALQAGRTAML